MEALKRGIPGVQVACISMQDASIADDDIQPWKLFSLQKLTPHSFMKCYRLTAEMFHSLHNYTLGGLNIVEVHS